MNRQDQIDRQDHMDRQNPMNHLGLPRMDQVVLQGLVVLTLMNLVDRFEVRLHLRRFLFLHQFRENLCYFY